VRSALLLLCVACATIPAPKGSPYPDARPGAEVDVCVLWSERHERPRLLGVQELSLEPWHQAIASVVIRRPIGDVIVDPAFGLDIAADLKRVPPWFTVISGDAKTKTPTLTRLEESGTSRLEIRDLLLTHPHWDHAGALRDFPSAHVRMSAADFAWITPMKRYLDSGVMPHHFDGVLGRVLPFMFDGPPVLRFDASHDMFGDGSVIAVPLPGHTPGSTGYLVRGRGGKRWLLIGDAAWTVRGVEKPAHKMVRLIDADGAKTSETLGRLHALYVEHPEIQIVPAHDAAGLETIPTCAP
jgi:N-acyl homoserine lactone hydrolase